MAESNALLEWTFFSESSIPKDVHQMLVEGETLLPPIKQSVTSQSSLIKDLSSGIYKE